jgi:hypothetical protein
LEVVNKPVQNEKVKINIKTLRNTEKETEKKANKIMKTYLGKEPDI